MKIQIKIKRDIIMNCKQQQLFNNINMSTSLPKIKILAENSQSGSQKQLKFRKLKLNTDQSAADIREKFKSVRTQRLTSIERYSTVQGQRQHKKQKIHLNMLERKLMSGTYDQKQQTGNDLNSLKQKTDLYKTQGTQKQLETEKVRQMIEQIKIEIQNCEVIKQKNDEAVAKVQRKYDQQKLRTEGLLSERSCLEHMIAQRKKVNHFLEGKINEDKTYLTKLKAVVKQVFTEARQSTESMRNLMSKIQKINNEALRQQRNREQIMYDKQSVINKRKDDEKLRQEKSIEFKKSLDEGEVELEKKDFMDLYKGILSHIFLQKYSRQTLESLQEKYQIMQNYFEKISSYKKFDRTKPELMVERYEKLSPQTAQFDDKAKKLQEKQLQLQKTNTKLKEKLKQTSLTITKPCQQQNKQIVKKSELMQKAQLEWKEEQRKLQNTKQQINEINEKLDKILRWVDRYGKQLQIKRRRSESVEQVGENIKNIIGVVMKEKESLEKRGKIQQR